MYLSEEGREVKQVISEETHGAVCLSRFEYADAIPNSDKFATWQKFPWLRVSILYHLPDKRRRDLSNLNKILLDGISEGIQVDDSKFLILEQPPNFDKARPRCEVIITGLTEAQANAQREAFVEVFEG